MRLYPRRNKIKTALSIAQRIRNWPAAFHMRFFRQSSGLRVLNFRDGTNVVCRAGTQDWDVVHELFFQRTYQLAMDWIAAQKGDLHVVDLGGNIGLFSLLTAMTNASVRITAFEPGPPNARLFRMNCLANPDHGARIELNEYAVGGLSGTAKWFFDPGNPGGSSLFGGEGKGTPLEVKMTAFADVLAPLKGRRVFVKMDIEGSEFDVLRHTSDEVLKSVAAYSLELHDDPEGKMSHDEYMQRFRALGFKIKEESAISYFIHRD